MRRQPMKKKSLRWNAFNINPQHLDLLGHGYNVPPGRTGPRSICASASPTLIVVRAWMGGRGGGSALQHNNLDGRAREEAEYERSPFVQRGRRCQSFSNRAVHCLAKLRTNAAFQSYRGASLVGHQHHQQHEDQQRSDDGGPGTSVKDAGCANTTVSTDSTG